jgi:hypothetical protein
VKPVTVDRCRGDHPHRDALGAPRNRPEEHLAALMRDLLRVVQEGERPDGMVAQPRVVEENAGDDQRTREASASGLVCSGDVSDSELPVEGEELAAGPTHAERIDTPSG